MLRAVAALAAILPALAMYGGDDVIQLGEKDFEKRVVKDSGMHFVEFYAPWCGHCKNLANDWKKTAKALKGIVGVVAVDATQAQSLASKYGVQGFPTLKFFGEDKSKPVDYNGGRDAASMVQFAMAEANKAVQRRLGGKASSSGGSGSGSGSKGSGSGSSGGADASKPGGGKAVLTLTDDNFEELVLKSSDPWMVEFYAPWCGHCKNLAPEWASAADQLKGEVKLGALDATQHPGVASRFDVKGYPTIKMFPGGPKTEASAQDYNGGRSASDLVAAGQRLAEESGGAGAEVAQLTGAKQWAEVCSGKRICVLAVLPHILDDGAAKRNARLATLKDAAGKQRGKPFRFLWSEVGAQGQLEQAMAVGLVPAMYAISAEKKVFTVYKGPFEASALSGFATGLTVRNSPDTAPFPASFDLAKGIVSATAWDGKDAAAQGGEEFSLEDLDL